MAFSSGFSFSVSKFAKKIEKERTCHASPTRIWIISKLAPIGLFLTVVLAVTVADTVAVMETIAGAITNHCALSGIRPILSAPSRQSFALFPIVGSMPNLVWLLCPGFDSHGLLSGNT